MLNEEWNDLQALQTLQRSGSNLFAPEFLQANNVSSHHQIAGSRPVQSALRGLPGQFAQANANIPQLNWQTAGLGHNVANFSPLYDSPGNRIRSNGPGLHNVIYQQKAVDGRRLEEIGQQQLHNLQQRLVDFVPASSSSDESGDDQDMGDGGHFQVPASCHNNPMGSFAFLNDRTRPLIGPGVRQSICAPYEYDNITANANIGDYVTTKEVSYASSDTDQQGLPTPRLPKSSSGGAVPVQYSLQVPQPAVMVFSRKMELGVAMTLLGTNRDPERTWDPARILSGYPDPTVSAQNPPLGISCEDFCRNYPNHLEGFWLDPIIQHKWSADEMSKHVEPGVKHAWVAQLQICKRPLNMLHKRLELRWKVLGPDGFAALDKAPKSMTAYKAGKSGQLKGRDPVQWLASLAR